MAYTEHVLVHLGGELAVVGFRVIRVGAGAETMGDAKIVPEKHVGWW